MLPLTRLSSSSSFYYNHQASCITTMRASVVARCTFASGDFKRKRRLIVDSPPEAAAQHIKQVTLFDPYPSFEAPHQFGYEVDRDGHWYVGHMMRTKQALPTWANRVDVIIEVRDARIPLTSAQTELNTTLRESGIRKLPRLIVLNKCDLVTPSMARRAQEMIEAHSNTQCVLATSVMKKGVVKIKEFMLASREIRFKSLGIYGLILGLPNTGKSTTINALKRLSLLASKTRYDSRDSMIGVSRAQARVTMSPGTTELIRAYQLSHNPTLYLVDTPGVTFHKDKSNPERNLKLAAVGTFPDHIFGELYIADYILWRLNNARLFQYVNVCALNAPTNDIRSVCREIAYQLCSDPCRDSGAMDVLSGARTFLKFYRNGLLGRYCLDALPTVNELNRYDNLVEEAEPPGPWGPNTYPLDQRATILTSYT